MEIGINAFKFSFLGWVFGITLSSLPAFLEGYSHEVSSSLLKGPSTRGGLVFNERDTIKEEFKTLEEDINAVKKLKLMVEMFRRIKRNNPLAYERMVNFFEKNRKARRLRRELKTIGKKKKLVAALENQLDSAAKCHPKSGKELIQMFVKGLSELYPDMTKMLLAELQGAQAGNEPTKKSTVGRNTTRRTSSPTKAANTTVKNKEEKSVNKEEKNVNKEEKNVNKEEKNVIKEEKNVNKEEKIVNKEEKIVKHEEININKGEKSANEEEKRKVEKQISSAKDQSCTTSSPSSSCRTTCTTTCSTSKMTLASCEEECMHRFAEHVKPLESDDNDIGDIRSHSRTTERIVNYGKFISRKPPKRRLGNRIQEELKLRNGPFKDFHVQGSICFSNPCRKSASAYHGLRPGSRGENKVSRINRAGMSSGNWKEWFPRDEDPLHALSMNAQEVNNKSPEGQPNNDTGSRHLKIGFGDDKVKGSDSYIGKLNRSLEKYSQNAATRATPDNQHTPVNKNDELSAFPVRKRARNKKRSMYVLYEK